MSTAQIDFDMNFEDGQQDEADKRLFVTFFTEAVQNESKTVETGRPIFDDVDMIRIMFPGSKDTTVGTAHYGYQQRFPKQWAQYKAKMDQTTSGTPLSSVTWLTKGQVAEMLAMNIRSVEQLAGMPDSMAQRFLNHHELKRQAQAYLDAAAGAAPLLKMTAELSKRDEQIAELQAQVATLVAASKASDKKG
jgi:hypothetical protein